MRFEEIVKKVDEERLYTTGEVASMLGVSSSTVRYWIKRGWLDGVRVGGRFRIEGKALLRFLGSERES